MCGLPGALSDTVTEAVRDPAPVGVNVTEIVQVAPAASVFGAIGHVFVCAKSPACVPPTAMLEISSGAAPELVRVTSWAALVVPTSWLPNVRLPGLSVTPGAVPVPLSAAVCGLPPALSEMLRAAVLEPAAVGVKVTEMVQLAPAARVLGLVGQVFVWPKSAALVPVSPIELIVSGAVPELVKVTFCAALEVPTACWPKPRLVGESVTAGAVATPVPASVTECGVPGALSLMLTEAVRAPAALGVKVTEIVQLFPGARVLGLSGQLLSWAKSPACAPASPMLEISSGAAPEFVSVTFWAALVVPTSWLPKVRLPGFRVTPATVPVPLSATVCGAPGALSAMLTLAVRLPAAVGAKVTEIVQLAPTASVLGLIGHVFVCA